MDASADCRFARHVTHIDKGTEEHLGSLSKEIGNSVPVSPTEPRSVLLGGNNYGSYNDLSPSSLLKKPNTSSISNLFTLQKTNSKTQIPCASPKLSACMISLPSNFNHVQHAATSGEAAELLGEEEDKATPLESIKSTLQSLFVFGSKTARRKAFNVAMNGPDLSDNQKVDLKQEFLIRESTVTKKKTERMNVNDFELLKVLGHGGFGVVRLVKEKATGEIFAMKSLVKAVTIERGQETHVKTERSLLSLASELGDWIVRLHYSFQDRDFLFFVLDYMPGGDLLGLLIKKDIFPDGFAKFYFAEIVLAIEEIHKLGMIHRDIKPDNFLFDGAGHLKLADFGLATDTRYTVSQPLESGAESTEILTRRHTAYSVVGTNNYVAPEVLKGQGYDKSCDWWSAGIILFEMIYGYPAFSSNTATATKKKILDFKKYLEFPSHPESTIDVRDIIRKLICDSNDRLGSRVLPIPSTDHRSLVRAMMQEGDAADIKAHDWFKSVEWKNIMQMTPPFVPELNSKMDTGYFEEIDPKEIEDMMKIDPLKGESTNFDGFTYLSPGVLGEVSRS